MKVLVVAEYYPRAGDPVLGIWAHRQALAAAAAGAEIRVLVLHRPVPPRAAIAARDTRGMLAPLRQPRRAQLDGLDVRYLHYLAPPRPRYYAHWGAWAAPLLARELRRLRRGEFRFDLIHAHYASPAGDAVRRAMPRAPLVVSVHGGDVLAIAQDSQRGRATVEQALQHARLVIANSRGTERRAAALGARRTRVVHLGTDLPAGEMATSGRRARAQAAAAARRNGSEPDELVTVANLVERKRHGDVARALWLLRDSHPKLRWTIVGDGPERPALERQVETLGLAERVTFTGSLPHEQAVARAREATAFVLPSVQEAFGVAYVEAMAGGVPAIGCIGEDGPEEIAQTAPGGGIRLVPPGDPERLAVELRDLLDDASYRAEVGAAARATVAAAFTWERCGKATVAAYEAALA